MGPYYDETKTCPKCGKKAILVRTGLVLATYAPQFPREWWCGCGYTEEGPVQRGKTSEQMRQEAWEEANK